MAKLEYDETGRLLFTQEMRKEYTILIPQMLPIHFGLFAKLLERTGYKVAILNNDGRSVVESGLKYVHNDACYPALLVIGQMIDAIQNQGYDPHKVALLITQTGGGCRASNYIHMLRKALEKAGLLERLDEEVLVLADPRCYDTHTGLPLDVGMGIGFFA